MGVTCLFYALDWAAWRASSSGERSSFVWQPPEPRAVREISADRSVQQWKYAIAAGDCWDLMRTALDADAQRTYDELFGSLFWESPYGPRQDLGELSGAMLSLDPENVAAQHRALLDDDLEGLEPFFDARCPPEGLIATFAELRRYLERWAALLARVRDTEALVGMG